MSTDTAGQRRIGWLEVSLFAALVAFVFQLFPSLGRQLLAVADFRTWSPAMWFGSNLAAVAILVAVRFGPSLGDWLQKEGRRQPARSNTASPRTNRDLDEYCRRQLPARRSR